jgi:hypothetical protein
VPLSGPAYMGYEGPRRENRIYRLDPGFLYFINIAKMHRGFNFGVPRLVLMFQMDSDRLILSPHGYEMAALDSFEGILPERIDYEVSRLNLEEK